MRRLRVGAVAAAALGVVLALGAVAPVEAGGAGRIKARIAKQSSGPYEIQVLSNIPTGKVKHFHVKVKNNTPNQPFNVNMTDLDDPDYTLRYFRNGTNISQAVQGTGYQFHLNAQQVKRFELRIKADAVSPDAACIYTNLEELGAGPGQGQARVGVNGGDCD